MFLCFLVVICGATLEAMHKRREKFMRFKKLMSAVAIATALMVGGSVTASACTGLYVGKDVSTTGNAYVGRSEDIGKRYNKIFTVHPAEDHEPGSMYPTLQGFTMPYPAHTYRYTMAKDSPLMENSPPNDEETFAEVGMNENGVAVSATVTINANTAARSADPYVRKVQESTGSAGISEISMGTVLLSQATSARHAVEILAGIIDTYGAYESNSLLFSDSNETWYFENLAGHQYAAIKMPDDKVAVMPNMSLLGVIDVTDKENVVVSPNLVSLAEENGFLSTDADGKINVANTYGNGLSWNKDGMGQLTRYYQGMYYFNKELAGELNLKPAEGESFGPVGLLFSPDHKVSALEALQLLGYRGEGSAYDSDATGAYAIGNNNQAECHIFEMRSDAASPLLNVQWLAMSRAEFSLYIPTFASLLTETDEIFHNESIQYTEDSLYWAFCELADTCDNDRDRYGVNVRKFWAAYQEKLIEQQNAVNEAMDKIYAYSPKLAEQKATALAKAVAKEAFGYADGMLKELQAFIASGDEGVFMPTALTEGKLPTYSFDMVDGTGLPGSDVISAKKILKKVVDYAVAATGTDEYINLIPDVKVTFDAALADAQTLLDDPDAVDTKQISDATFALINEVNKLSFQKGEKKELQALYNEAVALDQDIYEDGAAKDNFNTALTNAKTVLDDENALQNEIDRAREELSLAKGQLVVAVVDKSQLKTAIDVADSYLEEDFQPEGWPEFQAALQGAKEVYADDAATNKQVKNAIDELLGTMFKLVYRQDKTQLNTVIEYANSRDLSLYTEASTADVTDALNKALEVQGDKAAIQPEIRTATNDLVDALLNLRLKADKSILTNLLAQANQIDLSLYSEESVERYLAAKADADTVSSQDLSDEEQAVIDNATDNLYRAMQELTEKGAAAQGVSDHAPVQGDSTAASTSVLPKTGDPVAFGGIAAVALLSLVSIQLIRKRRK